MVFILLFVLYNSFYIDYYLFIAVYVKMENTNKKGKKGKIMTGPGGVGWGLFGLLLWRIREEELFIY